MDVNSPSAQRRIRPKPINAEVLKNAVMTRGINEEYNNRLKEWFESKSN